MAWKSITTDLALLVIVGVAAVFPAALAHGPEPRGPRDIVRLQGYRGSAPAGAKIVHEFVLSAHGTEHRFFAIDWQRLALQPNPEANAHAAQRLTLQADLPVLNRFANARPEQKVTLLAEQRPGSSDLFIVALDLCPEK